MTPSPVVVAKATPTPMSAPSVPRLSAPPGPTLPPTPEPAPEPRVHVPTWPDYQRTGVASVDRVLDAWFSGDVQQVISAIEFTPRSCSHRLRTPHSAWPMCEATEVEGTLVGAFHIGYRPYRQPEVTAQVIRAPAPQTPRLVAVEIRPGSDVRPCYVIHLAAPIRVGSDAELSRLHVGAFGWTGSFGACQDEVAAPSVPPDHNENETAGQDEAEQAAPKPRWLLPPRS